MVRASTSVAERRLGTAWEHGRFDAVRGPSKVLFGRMYEDPTIELEAFGGRGGGRGGGREGQRANPEGRVFCIASAGCTALALAPHHEVVAVDINPVQLAYAQRRIEGGGPVRGMAERLMDAARFFAPLTGWTRSRLDAFLACDDTAEQLALWRSGLDTRRFRWAFDGLLSLTTLRAVYASPFLAFLPRRLGRVMRGRMERGFARHPNRDNPYAHLLLLGELSAPSADPVPAQARDIRLEVGDAASFLESQPPQSFAGFSLSNILDGAEGDYRSRLFAAVRRAAKPDAMVVLRSFGEPSGVLPTNRAADDRSMLWGIVDVKPASSL